MFPRILVANRGEIAVRVFSTLKRMGIDSVAVYSDVDADSLHVRSADEAVLIGGAFVADSYLRMDRIIEAALQTGAEAIHPGYGLLAENPEFARACADAGIVFIGPSPESMEAMSSKIAARTTMAKAGVPVVPGLTDAIVWGEEAPRIAAEIGYPVAVKASSGGGGKGFRIAESPEGLQSAIEGASGEGERFFGDPTVYLERYLVDPRHVEVQVLGDKHGNLIHLFERDCSIQRRHQKLVEESPSPALDDSLRQMIGNVAIDAARAVDYYSLGTVEGLLVGDEFFFLEMNTRIQVEHPVTEMVTGIDLVEEQIKVAANEELSLKQEDVQLRGHAIEVRINAENAAKNFRPSPGVLSEFSVPDLANVRIDTGVLAGDTVHPFYDPMIAKFIAWGSDRAEATRLLLEALSRTEISGIKTLMPFHQALLKTEEWQHASTCRSLLEDKAWLRGIEN